MCEYDGTDNNSKRVLDYPSFKNQYLPRIGAILL